MPIELWISAAAVFGLATGSFLNVVIHRLPKMMEAEWRAQCAELNGAAVADAGSYNLLVPGSHCPKCKAPLKAQHNIPLLSYVVQRGKCASVSYTHLTLPTILLV